MSRAFTREDDARDTFVPRPVSVLPPGARNYMTPEGARRLEEEKAQLAARRPVLVTTAAEPGAEGAGAQEELARVDQRLSALELALRNAEVVQPPAPPHDQVRFGATVTVRDQKGAVEKYRIVGADEADFERNEVSWVSPIARALLNARLGQKVPFKFPAGVSQLEIIAIEYA